MRILINDISATAGGGITSTRNYLNQLQNIERKHEFFVFVPTSRKTEYQNHAHNMCLRTSDFAAKSFIHRMLWEQYWLRHECIRRYGSARHIKFTTIPHGFDTDFFNRCQEPLSERILNQLKLDETYKRILFVSHYNYFRNFETLIKAIPFIEKQLSEPIMIVLTTKIEAGMIHGGYDSTHAGRLIDSLGVRSDIAMLGAVPYEQIHRLYKCCDLFVCPSYAETFGHPMVEAMASGLPVVAAGLPVHREVCQDAAVYFDVFDERKLAEKCRMVLQSQQLYQQLRRNGLKRSQDFSWGKHVKSFLNIVETLVGNK